MKSSAIDNFLAQHNKQFEPTIEKVTKPKYELTYKAKVHRKALNQIVHRIGKKKNNYADIWIDLYRRFNEVSSKKDKIVFPNGKTDVAVKAEDLTPVMISYSAMLHPLDQVQMMDQMYALLRIAEKAYCNDR